MKTRYSCFTPEQQEQFDKLNIRQQKYIIFRSQGQSKRGAYYMAGYSNTKWATQSAYAMEKDLNMVPLIEAMQGQQKKKTEVLKEKSDISKQIDKKVDVLPPELDLLFDRVEKDSDVLDVEPVNVEELTLQQADNVQFYRRIANGATKTVKVTKFYDQDGKLTSKKVEETSDLSTRIMAQKEVSRLLGLHDVLTLGEVKANNINIMIVDASRKKDMKDTRDVELSPDKFEVKEEEVRAKGKGKETDRDEQTDD